MAFHKKCENPLSINFLGWGFPESLGRVLGSAEDAIYRNIIGPGYRKPTLIKEARHIYECDACFNNIAWYYGEAKAALIVDSRLKGLISELKNTGFELSDRYFAALLKKTRFIGHDIKSLEFFIPGYSELIRDLEEHQKDIFEKFPSFRPS